MNEKHLEQVIEQQKTLSSEINELNTALQQKRDQFLKLQGIREYIETINQQNQMSPDVLSEEGELDV